MRPWLCRAAALACGRAPCASAAAIACRELVVRHDPPGIPMGMAIAFGSVHRKGMLETGERKRCEAFHLPLFTRALRNFRWRGTQTAAWHTPFSCMHIRFRMRRQCGRSRRRLAGTWKEGRGPALGGPGTYRFLRYMCSGTFYASL